MTADCTIHCVNATFEQLSFVETSPKDPQRDIVVPNSNGIVTVTDHTQGWVHVVVCQNPVLQEELSCQNGDQNVKDYTIWDSNGLAGINGSVSSGPEDSFKTTVTNKMPDLYHCLLIYGDESSGTKVPGKIGGVDGSAGTSITINNPSTIDVKVILSPVVDKEVQFKWNGNKAIIKTVTASQAVKGGPITITPSDGPPG